MNYRYKKISVGGRKVDEHRYLMEQFVGRPLLRTEDVHHIDHNPRNNNVSNLIILSRREHARIHASGREYSETTRSKLSLAARRTLNSAKLSIEQAKNIRELILKGLSQKELVEKFGVSRSTINRIKNNKIWSW